MPLLAVREAGVFTSLIEICIGVPAPSAGDGLREWLLELPPNPWACVARCRRQSYEARHMKAILGLSAPFSLVCPIRPNHDTQSNVGDLVIEICRMAPSVEDR
ncbi:hypothetical protein [Methylorubrum aminovorans]